MCQLYFHCTNHYEDAHFFPRDENLFPSRGRFISIVMEFQPHRDVKLQISMLAKILHFY